MSEDLFFPVDNVTVEGLVDWSDPAQKGKITTASVRGLRRQSSQAGTLVELNDTKVALFRYRDKVYAIHERCPHAGGPLHIGDLEELPDLSLCVRCPWHSWCFDLQTGEVKRPAGRSARAQVYATRVGQDGTIYVGFKEFSPGYFTSEDF